MSNGPQLSEPPEGEQKSEPTKREESATLTRIRLAQFKNRAWLFSLLLMAIIVPLTGAVMWAWPSQYSWYYIIAAVLVISGIALLLIWKLPKWQVDRYRESLAAKDQVELEIQARSTMIQIVGGIAVIASIAFTAANLQLTTKNVASAEKNFRATNELARFTQITERYSKAVEQLQSSRMEERLVGIYSLGILAQETAGLSKEASPPTSDTGAETTLVQRANEYYELIMLVLAAHVRSSSARPTPSPDRSARPQTDNSGAQSVTPKVPDDIQAILKVIGSRDVQSEGNVFEIDLHETDLRGAVMIGHFERVNFIGCDLAETDFTSAQLTSAKLYRANLTLAVFSNANMESADLSQVIATNTKFDGVHFSGATLSNAHIDGSDFTNAQLDGVDLRGATGKGNFFTKTQTTAKMAVNPGWFEDQIIVN